MKINEAGAVVFVDSGREPQCPPDPEFPNGMSLDLSNDKRPACGFEIPYPAPRCGMMLVTCPECGKKAGFTVAGRPDDVKFVVLPCKSKLQSTH